MNHSAFRLITGGLMVFGALALTPYVAAHGPDEAEAKVEEHHDDEVAHGHMGGTMPHDLEEMRELHRGHQHRHDFEVMEHMSPEERDRVLALMRDIGLALPPMDPARGRDLFLDRGCVACHSVNGVGGHLGPSLNAADMPEPMNAFEFAARMWRGAEAMTALQQDILGRVISLSGQDLADIIAFAHDEREQAKLRVEQVPKEYRDLIQDQ